MRKHEQVYFQDAVTEILGDIGDLLIRKQIDYGPAAITRFGLQGIIIRMSDKLERIINLIRLKADPEVNESIEDTLADIVGYAVLGLVLQKYGTIPPIKRKDQVQ